LAGSFSVTEVRRLSCTLLCGTDGGKLRWTHNGIDDRKETPCFNVADESLADFIVVGGTNKGTHKWYDTVFGSGYERDRNQGSVRIIRVRDKTIIWGAQKGDRSLWWGALKKGGKRKVAERLVNEMKDDLFKGGF